MKKIKERNMEDHDIEGNNDPTYTKAEILERLGWCRSIPDLRLYGDLLGEEKYRYSLNDLEEMHEAWSDRYWFIVLSAWIDRI